MLSTKKNKHVLFFPINKENSEKSKKIIFVRSIHWKEKKNIEYSFYNESFNIVIYEDVGNVLRRC